MSKQYKSAREFAEAISKGEIPASFNGTPTYEVLRQQLFSLKNEYNPQGWISNTGYVDPKLQKWNQRMADTLKGVSKLTTDEQTKLNDEVDKMLSPND